MGHAFYTSPIQFKNKTNGKAFSFSTSFAFTIVPEYPKLGGHGLAFTIAPSKDLKALPSQYLGLLNGSEIGNLSTHMFAVEFDTVQDFEFGDINDNHVGIDINSLSSNDSAAAAYYKDSATKQSTTTMHVLAGDGFNTIARSKTSLELQCPGVVSCADIISAELPSSS